LQTSATLGSSEGGYRRPGYDQSGTSDFIPQPPPVPFAERNDPYNDVKEYPKSVLDIYRDMAGTSAPTMLALAGSIAALSKELLILHPETTYYVSFGVVLLVLIKKVGPLYQEYSDKVRAETLAELEGERNERRVLIDDELNQLQSNADLLSTTDELFAVFKDTRTMEAEAKYRTNLLEVETEVKNRLDYQVDLQNLKRKLEQQHMAQWLENAVVGSITPEQEQQTLLKCIEDIDALAEAHVATA